MPLLRDSISLIPTEPGDTAECGFISKSHDVTVNMLSANMIEYFFMILRN